jgi:hypothetical protein
MWSPYDGLDEVKADALHAEARRITELPPSERTAAVTLSASDPVARSRLAAVVGSMRSPYDGLNEGEADALHAEARRITELPPSERTAVVTLSASDPVARSRLASVVGSMRSPYDGLDEVKADALQAEARRITELPPSERAAAVTLSAPDRDGHSRLASVVGNMRSRSPYDGFDTAAASAAALAQATAEGLSLRKTTSQASQTGFTGVYRVRSRFQVKVRRAGKLRFIGAFGTAEEGALARERDVVQAERVAAAARVEAGVEAEADMSDTSPIVMDWAAVRVAVRGCRALIW